MIGLIQARMSSTRLPGKVMKKIKDLPLIKYVWDRCKLSNLENWAIVTSEQESDNLLFDFCIKNEISCYRGSLDNVAERFLEATENFGHDSFIRINGDSPLIDPEIINRAINLYSSENYDIVTNAFPKSYPLGQSVEIVRLNTFSSIFSNKMNKDHYEHVTKYIYDNSGNYRIHNFRNFEDMSKYSTAVDTQSDFNKIEKIFHSLIKLKLMPDYSFLDVVELYPNND